MTSGSMPGRSDQAPAPSAQSAQHAPSAHPIQPGQSVSAGEVPVQGGVLVRFGEIGIKSPPVRHAMLGRLRNNLLSLMERRQVEGDVQRMGSRLWMVGPDLEALIGVATHTFGVVSASPAKRTDATMEAITRAAAEEALATPGWTTFAVRGRREGTHGFSSQDINVQAGSAVFLAAKAAGRTPKVDLGQPDLTVDIDVRGPHAFVFTRHAEGPGGIPMGSQGRVLALLSDEASFVAAWLMARRGCAVHFLHAGDTGSMPTDALSALAQWGLPQEAHLLPVCTGRVAKPVLLEAAVHVAMDVGAAALVTGETLSSTLVPAALPVLRPVCGLAGAEYRRFRDAIGLPEGADAYPSRIVDPAGRESLDSLLSLRRMVGL